MKRDLLIDQNNIYNSKDLFELGQITATFYDKFRKNTDDEIHDFTEKEKEYKRDKIYQTIKPLKKTQKSTDLEEIKT